MQQATKFRQVSKTFYFCVDNFPESLKNCGELFQFLLQIMIWKQISVLYKPPSNFSFLLKERKTHVYFLQNPCCVCEKSVGKAFFCCTKGQSGKKEQ